MYQTLKSCEKCVDNRFQRVYCVVTEQPQQPKFERRLKMFTVTGRNKNGWEELGKAATLKEVEKLITEAKGKGYYSFQWQAI